MHRGGFDSRYYNDDGTYRYLGDRDSEQPPVYSGRVNRATVAPPHVALSGSVLDNPIPHQYGSARVTGMIGARKKTGTYTWTIGVVFAFGEQNSVGSIQINGESTGGLGWISSLSTHTGDGSTALSGLLTAFLSAGEQARWKNYAHCVFTLDLSKANAPGSLTVSAELGGRKVTDFRTGGSSASTNPVLVAYDQLTSAKGAGVATSRFGTAAGGTWREVADQCDETMGDGSVRYHYRGTVTNRDPYAAADLALEHCLARMYVGPDGKIQLWAEKPPPAITGDWSGVGTQITEDAASGSATGEVSAGDIVIVGTGVAYVASVPDDDTINLDRSVNVAGVKVRTTSNVHIRKENWVSPPLFSELAASHEIPDDVVVRYRLPGYTGGSQYPTSPSGSKWGETSLPGCRSASMARRISETQQGLWEKVIYSWTGVADGIAAELEPGMIALFDDDQLTEKLVRVISVEWLEPRVFALSLREFRIDAYSDNTASDPTPPAEDKWASQAGTIISDLRGEYLGSVYQQLYVGGSGEATLGDGSRTAVLNGITVVLPNDIPFYGKKTGGSTHQLLKIDSSDRGVLGDGSYDLYLNAYSKIIMPQDVRICSDWANKRRLIELVSGPPARVNIGDSYSYYTRIDSLNGLEITGKQVLLYDGSSYYAALYYYSTYGTRVDGQPSLRLRATSGGVVDVLVAARTAARFDDTSTAGNTSLLVYDVDNASLERVTVGAANSGGSGYKVLRIPN